MSLLTSGAQNPSLHVLTAYLSSDTSGIIIQWKNKVKDVRKPDKMFYYKESDIYSLK